MKVTVVCSSVTEMLRNGKTVTRAAELCVQEEGRVGVLRFDHGVGLPTGVLKAGETYELSITPATDTARYAAAQREIDAKHVELSGYSGEVRK